MPKKAKSKSKGRKVQRWKEYKVNGGNAVLKNKICPKCSSVLAEMKDRKYCGKCHYTEISKKQ